MTSVTHDRSSQHLGQLRQEDLVLLRRADRDPQAVDHAQVRPAEVADIDAAPGQLGDDRTAHRRPAAGPG